MPYSPELTDLSSSSALDFDLLKRIVEKASCTGVAVDDQLRNTDLSIYSNTEVSIVNSFQAVDYWLSWDPSKLDQLFKNAIGRAASEVVNIDAMHAQAHMKLIARLFMQRLQKPTLYAAHDHKCIYAIGDSHSLEIANISTNWKAVNSKIISAPIRGIKMFHLGIGANEKYRQYFSERLANIPKDSEIILSIGEIDCRPNEGIFAQYLKLGKKGQSCKYHHQNN